MPRLNTGTFPQFQSISLPGMAAMTLPEAVEAALADAMSRRWSILGTEEAQTLSLRGLTTATADQIDGIFDVSMEEIVKDLRGPLDIAHAALEVIILAAEDSGLLMPSLSDVEERILDAFFEQHPDELECGCSPGTSLFFTRHRQCLIRQNRFW